MNDRPHILVAAGLIWGDDGRILISKRPEGGPHAGCWELPGGKVEAGETIADALVREVMEELGIEIQAGPEFNRVTHDYPKLTVTLVGLHAHYLGGEPQTLEVAEWRWVQPEELLNYTYPEANQRLFASDWRNKPAF